MERQHAITSAASPAAADLIRRWAQQTAVYGAIDSPDDDAIDEVVDQ
jgi:hypothetical protein